KDEHVNGIGRAI
ncbi:hypothetical protein CISIN_1g0226702mg, partial [Citrus sinensis]